MAEQCTPIGEHPLQRNRPLHGIHVNMEILHDAITESIMHWTPNCQHLKPANPTLLPPPELYRHEEYDIILHQSDHDSPHQMDTRNQHRVTTKCQSQFSIFFC